MSLSPSTSEIHYVDFGRPVLNFVVRSEDAIWVLLDGQWGEVAGEGSMVRRIKWDTVAEEFKEDEGMTNALLTSLNSSCLLPATPADLKSLDLYAHLSSMPKNSSDDVDGPVGEIPHGRKNKTKSHQTRPVMTKRQLGRLKNKQALVRVIEGSMGKEQHNKDDAYEGKKCETSENKEDKNLVMDVTQ